MEIQNTEMFENFDNYMSDDDIYTYSSSVPIFEESEGESDEDYEEQEDRTDELSDNENFDDIHETEKKAPKKELTPCVIVTNINRSIRHCAKHTDKQRRFWNLAGVWEVDKCAVEEMKNEPEKLGVCYTHYMFDRNYLYERGSDKSDSLCNQYLFPF